MYTKNIGLIKSVKRDVQIARPRGIQTTRYQNLITFNKNYLKKRILLEVVVGYLQNIQKVRENIFDMPISNLSCKIMGVFMIRTERLLKLVLKMAKTV